MGFWISLLKRNGLGMNTHSLSSFRQMLRIVACVLAPAFLVLLAAVVLVSQFTELATRNELLSLTSFIVILSLSGLAFNWSRVSASFAPEVLLKKIYQAGVDLFLASILAMIATGFAWLQSIQYFKSPVEGPRQVLDIYPILFWVHWLFLCLALLMTLAAIASIMIAVKQTNEMN